jgi:hypothetical protein
VRKYAEGELATEKSFYFTGAENKLHLRAHNLMTFIQLADGIDDETWLHHLKQHDYSNWIRDAIADDELSDAVRAAENDESSDTRTARNNIIEAIRERYTAPA